MCFVDVHVHVPHFRKACWWMSHRVTQSIIMTADLEIEKEIVREVARGDKPNLRKICRSQSTNQSADWTSAFLICALRSVDFLSLTGKVYFEPPHAQSPFIFPVVFGINLIHFFDGKNNLGLGRIWSFVLGLRSLAARLTLCRKSEEKTWRKKHCDSEIWQRPEECSGDGMKNRKRMTDVD